MDTDAVLPVLPWTAAALAVVLLVGLQVPAPARPGQRGGAPAPRPATVVAVAVLLGALAVCARLLGETELDNPTSPLVVGLSWPLLLLVPLLLSPLGARRALTAPTGGDARPALPLALLVVGLLAVVPAPGRPGVLGPALGAYAVLLLAAGVAGGLSFAARSDVLVRPDEVEAVLMTIKGGTD